MKQLNDYKTYGQIFYIKKYLNGEEIDFTKHFLQGFINILIGTKLLSNLISDKPINCDTTSKSSTKRK